MHTTSDLLTRDGRVEFAQKVLFELGKLGVTSIIAIGLWVIASDKSSAVTERRLVSIEQQIPMKASKESMDQFQREVVNRLDRIENKRDRAERMAR